jgi:IS5 family transposase
MNQATLHPNLSLKKTRKQVFLDQMEHVVPWAALVELIAPYYPEGKTGRPPFSLVTMLRIHFIQQWFTLSDPAMEEAFFDTPLCREFAQLEEFGRLPDESTILRFRHRLEKHKLAEEILSVVNELLSKKGLLLKAGTAVDATLISAPISTKNTNRKRDPEMRSSKKGNQWYSGMKAHIGHAVCAVQPVDGARQIDGIRGLSAPESRANGLQGAKSVQTGRKTERSAEDHA